MSATIHIESGISAGTSYWIDRPVLRVGSDPQCEICLPSAELAPHVLTIEFRDGRYRAYNRSTTPVLLDGVSIQPGGVGDFRPDETLELPGDVRLALRIDGDPRPCLRPAESHGRFDDSDDFAPVDSPAEVDASTKKSSKSLMQLAIIVFCVLGSGAFLTMRGGAEEIAVDRPTFEALVEESLPQNAATRDRLHRLQYAQAALVRGHRPLAKQRFAKLRDQLVRQNEPLSDEERVNADKMLDYVEFRLGQLQ